MIHLASPSAIGAALGWHAHIATVIELCSILVPVEAQQRLHFMALSSFFACYSRHRADYPFIDQLVHVFMADLVLQGLVVNDIHDCSQVTYGSIVRVIAFLKAVGERRPLIRRRYKQ